MGTVTTGLRPAASYLRRSTDRQEKSLEDQRREIFRYAAENGFGIVAEFVDDGISGTAGDTRPGFISMLEAARAPGRAWNTILVWDIKRFGRMSSDEVGHYRWMLKQAGVEIIYTSEGFSGSSSDRFVRFFKQEAARDESASLSKAVIRGLVHLTDDGWWPGGPAPYGYDAAYYDSAGRLFCVVRYSDDREKLVLDTEGRLMRTVPLGEKVKGSDSDHVKLTPGLPERIEVVRRVFAWYTGSSSLGFKAIADRLNREGIVSPKRRGWALSSIRTMLMNQVYVGRIVWNRRSMGKFHRIADRREVERDGCGKRRLEWNDRQNWIIHENAHEPIIAPEVFERAQRIMKERAEETYAAGFITGSAKVSRYLLSGLLQCGACGGAMHGRTTWKSQRRKDGSRVGTSYYVCGASVTKGKAICQPIQFLQSAMDDFVVNLVGERIAALLGRNGRAVLRRLVAKDLETGVKDPKPEIRRLKARLAEVATKADSVIDMATASPEHRGLLNERLARLRDERQGIEARLRELELVPDRVTDVDAVVETILRGLADARHLFDHGTIDEKKRVIRAFIEGGKVVASERTGEIRVRQLPEVASIGGNNSVGVVAGAGFEPATFGL